MKHIILIFALTAGFPGVAAAEPATDWQRAMDEAAAKLRQELDKALGSAQDLLRSVPQYELPQINENGDIIIRRKRPPADPWRAPTERAGAQLI
jgi:hypothetical protein